MKSSRWLQLQAVALFCLTGLVGAQSAAHLYGIHDHSVGEQEFLNHLNNGAVSGWVTATVEVGDDPDNYAGADFRNISSQGHAVICRINRGYGATGTIPPPALYDHFALRCARFVAATQGCDLFVIGNETNLASEWPVVNNHRYYISPQDYAVCFRKCYDAIKAVRPEARVIPQALAPFAGPYGAGTIDGVAHDANPLNWVQYLHQMLSAIQGSGGIDGIALHINSRGYGYGDIHSSARVDAAGQQLYFSFYVYKDWVNLGIPAQLYHLPLYATECNGIYYWKGGHPENPAAHYESGWVQEIYAEINRYNQTAQTEGMPLFHCINLYRWCSYCDDWNIDGCSYKGLILADLDQAILQRYSPPGSGTMPPHAVISAQPASGTAPLTVSFSGEASSDPNSDPLSFAWDFGDGAQGTGVSVQHTYPNAGTYMASLTVQDGQGGSDIATTPITVDPPGAVENLLVNGAFENGLSGWQVWSERGSADAAVSGGMAHISGSNFNGGIFQTFNTGGPGTTIQLSGFWQSTPVVANAQWAEVLIINSERTPLNGEDINGSQSDVVLACKNDTWMSPAGWSGEMTNTAPGANQPLFTASAQTATIVLKCGSSTAAVTGAAFDNLAATAIADPGNNQAPTARLVTGSKNGLIPLTVSFAAGASSDPDGDPLSYHWDFGDGTQASGEQQTHTFQNRGAHLVRLTVNDGRGGMHTAQTVVYARTRGTGPVDFDAMRQQLNQQGMDLAFVKIGFHVGPGGNRTGISDYMNALDAAGAPFAIKSVCDAGIILQGAQMKESSGVPHSLVYRGWHDDGWYGDIPDYNLTPCDAAVLHWQRHMSILAAELFPYRHLFWIETINEVDKNRCEWIGEFCYHTALIAMAEGFNWAGPSWSTGEPEPHHWQGPWMKKYLTLAAQNPERVAVALHEYSLVRENLTNMYPYLVGRFQSLYAICDGWGIAHPTLLVTEFGWGPEHIAYTVQQAMNSDLPWAAELYGQFPSVESAAIWYLGPGFGAIADEAQKLIAPVTDWALRNYFVVPLAGGNRPPYAQFTAAPLSGNVPLLVTFDATASGDPDGDAITCSWDFGDGTRGSGAVVTHTYQQAGTFAVHLTVRDAHGTEAVQVQSVQAIDPGGIMVWEVIQEEYFDTYDDWYDQGQQQVRNGWILWNDEGHNPLGNPNYTEPWNDWRWPEGTFNWAAYIPPQEHALFLNERGFCYKIFCGYGAWHSRFITPNLALTAGTYRLRMRYWADIVDHYEGTTKVPPADPRAFEGKVNLGEMEGEWHYPNYLQDNAVEEVFDLPQAGTITASFEFRGRWALKHVGAWIKYFVVEKLVQVHIANRPPVPQFTANPCEGAANLTVQFDAGPSSDADGDALTCQWDFGDGSRGSGCTAAHTYTYAGLKMVTLTVDDGHGHARSAGRTIQVHDANAAVTWVPVVEEFFDTTSDFQVQDNQQVRNGWTLWNNSGYNPLGNPDGNEPWNDWKRAEARFFWSDHLSAAEQALFLNEKGFCYRLLAGWSAWNARLSSPLVTLPAGIYRLRCRFYADVYTDVQNEIKIPAQDLLAFEFRCHLGGREGVWIPANVLGDNIMEQVFEIGQEGQYAAGFEWRGRWAFRTVAAWVRWLRVGRLTSGALVDNGRSGYSQIGTWTASSADGHFDTPSVVSETPGSVAQWRPVLNQTGLYQVYTRWTADARRAENALYTVTHQNGSQGMRVNQRLSGGNWVELGTWQFAAGQSGLVTLTCENAGAPVAADACLFLYSGSGGASTTLVYDFPRPGIYLISVPGEAADMSVAALFPDADGGVALDYVNDDYVPVTTLQTGVGYWLHITTAGQVSVTVQPITSYTRPLTALSWNQLGSVITSQPLDDVQVTPPGSLTPLFAYDPLRNSYFVTEAIEPQQGYWAGCVQDCEVTVGMSAQPSQQLTVTAVMGAMPAPPDRSLWRRGDAPLPSQFTVLQNYPNPFNPETLIAYALPQAENVRVTIHNALGQVVRQLVNRRQAAGVHQTVWDANDEAGHRVSAGIYFYSVCADRERHIGKMVLLP